MNYEELLTEADQDEIQVIEYDFVSPNIKGLYCDGTVALNSSGTDTEKACVLAEELGHHYTSDGIILTQADTGNRKQERRARFWAYRKAFDLADLIQAFKAGCRSSTISAKTLKNEWGLLSAALNYFDIDYNPKKIKLPMIPKKIVDLPSPAVIMSIIRDTDVELPCLLAMWLSLSESEIAGLTKSRSLIDNGKYLAVQEVVLHINGKAVSKDTAKADTRVRVLRLPEYLRDLIAAVDTDQIVPMLPNTYYRHFQKLLKSNGIKPITFHQLRHVNASVMAQLLIPDKYAQERGGWSSDRVMKSVYTHTFSAERVAVDDKIDSYFYSLLGNNEKLSHEISHELKKVQ